MTEAVLRIKLGRYTALLSLYCAVVVLWPGAPMQAAPANTMPVIINEVLANEPGSAVALEWVELYNRSGSTVDLSRYVLVDAKDTTVLSGLVLPAGGYAVLARRLTGRPGEDSFESHWGNNSGVWGDAEIEKYPALTAVMKLRNSADTVILRGPGGAISIFWWESDAGDGVSFERVRPDSPDDLLSFTPSRDTSGSTPGRINSWTPRPNDLTIDSIGILLSPSPPQEDQPFSLSVPVKNVGLGWSNDNRLTVADDVNLNGNVDTTEVLAVLSIPALEEVQATALVFTGQLAGGIHRLILALSPDGNPANNSTSYVFKVAFAQPELVINEYLCDPAPDRSEEWIELYNRSDHVVLLSGWRIGDALAQSMILADSAQMLPGAYVIVCEDQSAFENAYINVEPQSVFKVTGWRRLNNAGDRIILLDEFGYIIDSLTYDTAYGGRSTERVDPDRSVQDAGNWQGSRDPCGGTPGRINSWTARPNDLAIDSNAVVIFPDPPRENQEIHMVIPIVNVGKDTSRASTLTIVDDADFDGIVDEHEILAALDIPALAEKQADTVWYRGMLSRGTHRVLFLLGDDDNLLNNSAAMRFKVVTTQPEIVVNEFLAAPGASEEWIELYNRSQYRVDLHGWRIGDALAWPQIAAESLWLDPGGFLIVCEDERAFHERYNPTGSTGTIAVENWRTLNDDADCILLVDDFGNVVDSINYTVSSADRSLERVDPDDQSGDEQNWRPCVDPIGATPGRINSVTRRQNDLAIDSSGIAIAPFPPREGISPTITIRVRNVGLGLSVQNVLMVGEDRDANGTISEGEILATLTVPALGEEQWIDLLFQHMFPGGRHRVIFQLGDDDNPLNNAVTRTFKVAFDRPEIVINEFLPDPPAGGSEEWIELYNRSEHGVDLKSWRLGDLSAQGAVVAETDMLCPGEYLIVCENRSAFLAAYLEVNAAKLIEMKGWPALNDNADGIMLVDDFGYVVDSIGYRGSSIGRSFERVDPDEKSGNAQNWRTCVDPVGATPGKINSVTRRFNDLALDSNGIAITPFPPREDAVLTLTIRVRNVGHGASVANVLTIAEDVAQDEGVAGEDTLASLAISSLAEGDSCNLSFQRAFQGGRHRVVFCIGDDGSLINNARTREFKAAFNQPELVISEFLPDPPPGKSEEWIELYNRSAHDVDLQHWRLGDSLAQAIITAETKLAHSGNYLVVCENRAAFEAAYPEVDPQAVIELHGWRTLNDTEDRIILLDDFGYLIDSLTYTTTYDGRSVERIDPNRDSGDPANWWSSVDPMGATPGRKNSTAVEYTDALRISISPNPFMAGQPVQINYTVPFRVSFTARVYDVNGRKMRTLLDNQPMASGTLMWDGRDESGRILPPGVYVLWCETDRGQMRKIVLAVRPEE